MSRTWRYMGLELVPDELPTMKDLPAEINENGGTDAARAAIRDRQCDQYGCELIWRYKRIVFSPMPVQLIELPMTIVVGIESGDCSICEIRVAEEIYV